MAKNLIVDLGLSNPAAATLGFDNNGVCINISVILDPDDVTTRLWTRLLTSLVGNTAACHPELTLEGQYTVHRFRNHATNTAVLLFSKGVQPLETDTVLTVERQYDGNIHASVRVPCVTKPRGHESVALVFDQYGGLLSGGLGTDRADSYV